MAEKKSSQTQQNQEFINKIAEDQVDRLEAAYDEWGKLEEKGLERANHTVDEVANLWKASFEYTAELSEQMRSLFAETTKQAFDAFTPRT